MILSLMKNPLRFSLYAAAVPAVILCAAFLDPYADRVNDGNANYNDGKFSEAGKSYDEAERYLPSKRDAAELAFNKGDARFGAGDYDGAVEFYKAALSSEKKDVQKKALFNMGNAFAKKGDKPSAADAYLSALRIDPSYVNAKKNLEALYRKDKNDDKNDKQKDKDKNQKQNQDQQQNKNQGKDRQDQAAKGMNKDQIKSLLQMMKDKPVRRQKNDEDKGLLGGGHEKPW